MDWTSLIAFAAALTLGAATPGPGIAAVVARALSSGFRSTTPMILGLIAGDIVYLSAAAFGLGVIAASFGTVFIVIRWLGVAHLIYLAFRLFTARPEQQDVPPQHNGRSTFLAGLLVTLGNPKVILFYLALLPTIIDLGSVSLVGFVELSGIVALVLAVVIGLYAALAARARLIFTSSRAKRTLNRIAGTAMLGAAGAIATRG